MQRQEKESISADSSSLNASSLHVAETGAVEAWRRLYWWEWLAVAAAVGLIAALVLWRLPPGVCFADSGELQVAAALLGIAHPPGYAGYVTLWHLLTLIPGVDPAYMVSLACLASGLLALMFCALIQIRLGVSAFLASAAALVLTMHPRVWTNLTAPEVYMPTLALTVAAVYGVMRYAAMGKRRDILVAAFLYGLALSSRPPVLFLAPFLVTASWLAGRHLDLPISHRMKTLGLTALVALAPCVYSVTYLLIRDQPTTAFNYLDIYNAEYHELPDAREGWSARVDRVRWLVTGQQFKHLMGNTWKGVRSKLRWLRSELVGRIRMPYWPVDAVLSFRKVLVPSLAGLCLLGLAVVWRRSRISAILLLGLCLSSLVFVCYYRIYGDAADILPLMLAMAVFGGVALSIALGRASTSFRGQLAPLIVLVAMLIFTLGDASERGQTARSADGTAFLRTADLASLPAGSIVCSNWGNATPLWYAQRVLHPDSTFEVVNAWESHWFDLLKDRLDRPIYAAVRPPKWAGFRWTPIRNLWRLDRL